MKTIVLALCLSGIAFGTTAPDLPIFTIGTVHNPSDSIVSVLVTACNFAATGFNECFNADTNGALATDNPLDILEGQAISISVAALAQPLNFWQNFFPYNTPFVAVRITNSQGEDCDSNVVAYNCTTSSACPGLSFVTPVTCNFN